ncbi:alpha-amylase family glycosyl hydrolase [Nitrospira sp. M1]
MNPRAVHPSCRPHPHLYEINTWVWLKALSRKENRLIRLGDVPDQEWDNLQGKGFDCIWLMGIWERSPHSQSIARRDPGLQKEYEKALPGWTVNDVVGSPYAIRAYRPDPELGTWDQLDYVLEKLHQRGMQLILDFVPNHTAVDHEWVRLHPEYYIQGTAKTLEASPDDFFTIRVNGRTLNLAHGKDPYFPAWTDTAQLNYFYEATRTALIEELKTIAQHCDGVRCDMAMLMLNEVFQKTWSDCLEIEGTPAIEFWTEAVTAVADFIWMAEVYWDREWDLQQLGFHFTYDKRLYDRLCHSSPGEIVAHLKADGSYQSHLVRFLENHDEPRSASTFGNIRLLAVSTLIATLPGMRLYHQGQLEGQRIRLPVQLARMKEELLDHETMEVYGHLLRMTNEEVFHEGQWRLLMIQSVGDSTFENLLGYEWVSRSAHKIVVVNLGSIRSQGFLHFLDNSETDNDLPSLFTYRDHLSGQTYISNYQDIVRQGLYISLEPFGAHIFSAST